MFAEVSFYLVDKSRVLLHIHTGGTRTQLFWIIYDIGTDTLHFGTDTSPKVVQIINLATETPSFSVRISIK